MSGPCSQSSRISVLVHLPEIIIEGRPILPAPESSPEAGNGWFVKERPGYSAPLLHPPLCSIGQACENV